MPKTGPDQAAGDITTREIGGVVCTNRAGIQTLTGRPAVTIRLYARNDDDFPRPVVKIGRSWWYRLDDARRYASLLADRRRELQPAPVAGGDPGELLGATAAAAALGITRGTLGRYITESLPHWEEGRAGILPRPDVESPARRGVHRQWYRRTLAAHQARRPGMGAGGGRPTGT